MIFSTHNTQVYIIMNNNPLVRVVNKQTIIYNIYMTTNKTELLSG